MGADQQLALNVNRLMDQVLRQYGDAFKRLREHLESLREHLESNPLEKGPNTTAAIKKLKDAMRGIF